MAGEAMSVTRLGLWITDDGAVSREDMRSMLAARMIPFEGFTDEAPAVDATLRGEEFLRGCIGALMQPGRPLPMAGVAECLGGSDARSGDVLRRYVCLQLSLAPLLRTGAEVTHLSGGFLVGQDLLVAPLGPDGAVDAQLPPGVWTEMSTGETMQGRLRRLRGLNAMPVLARGNALIPVGVCDTRTDAPDADRVTLHWYEPQGAAERILADGTRYAVRLGDGVTAESDSALPWHLIIHRAGEERFVR